MRSVIAAIQLPSPELPFSNGLVAMHYPSASVHVTAFAGRRAFSTPTAMFRSRGIMDARLTCCGRWISGAEAKETDRKKSH